MEEPGIDLKLENPFPDLIFRYMDCHPQMPLSGIHDFSQLDWIPDQNLFGNDDFQG